MSTAHRFSAGKCVVLSPDDRKVELACFKTDRDRWVTCFKLEENDVQSLQQVGKWKDVLEPQPEKRPFLINCINPDNQLPCHDPLLITWSPCTYIIEFTSTDESNQKIAHLRRVLRYIEMLGFLPKEGEQISSRKPTVFILLSGNGGNHDLKAELERETTRYGRVDCQLVEELCPSAIKCLASRLVLSDKYLHCLDILGEQEVVSVGELKKKIQFLDESTLLNALQMFHQQGFVFFKKPHDTQEDNAIVFTQPRHLFELLRPVANYRQSESGLDVWQLFDDVKPDSELENALDSLRFHPELENALNSLLVDLGIAMKTLHNEHIIMATLEEHNTSVEPRYCMDPLLVSCKSLPGQCYMPDLVFWGLAYQLSKVENWVMTKMSSSYFRYHCSDDGAFIHVTSRKYFLEIGIQQGEISRTHLKNSLPEQLHEMCSKIRQTVTKQLFTVACQLIGNSHCCEDQADTCQCSAHKRFRMHYPVGFPCKEHDNCIMQFHHIGSVFLECGGAQSGNTTYKQEIWFMPPRSTVKAETRSVEIEGSHQNLVFLEESTACGHEDREADESSWDQVAMKDSVGQRSVPFAKLKDAAAAMCRIKWTRYHSTYYGSGSIVAEGQQFFLLTCCHNFLTVQGAKKLLQRDWTKPQPLLEDVLKQELMANCKAAYYEFYPSSASQHGDDQAGCSYGACDVLVLNGGGPILHFDKAKDMLAIKVKNPDSFGISKPIPLKSHVQREDLVSEAEVFSIFHFPFGKYYMAGPLEYATGDRCYGVPSDTDSVAYTLDTYVGSSGSPLLYSGDTGIGIVVMAVHRKGSFKRQFNEGSILTQSFLSGMKKLYD